MFCRSINWVYVPENQEFAFYSHYSRVRECVPVWIDTVTWSKAWSFLMYKVSMIKEKARNPIPFREWVVLLPLTKSLFF